MSSMSFIAFAGDRCIASGDLGAVARAAKATLDRHKDAQILVFDDDSGPIDLDLRGSVEDVLARLPEMPEASAVEAVAPAPRGPGRPKLGVVAREVTLLPRHWEWLNRQPGGASVALRKLVEEARRANTGRDRVRQSQEACYRFMSAMAGDQPGFEEATRALFTGNRERFDQQTEAW